MQFRTALASLAAVLGLGLLWTARGAQGGAEAGFAETVQPFLRKNCVSCHNTDTAVAGIRVDMLTAGMEDRHMKLWSEVQHRISDGTMPPKGMKQPTAEERKPVVEWIGKQLEVVRLRPTPKNGAVRRLTVAQYKNTLRELLGLEDDLTEILPPDAVSKDGFLNNKETLQLSPLLLEAYLGIADEALTRAIVNPGEKPDIQNFRMDLGAGVNPAPIREELILGAGSTLLENQDVLVTQLTPKKPFAFDPFFMKTKYRYIEGYQGNDTVRGWREYDSIYHAVFADMRGSNGYPKGKAYSTVPEGLLLRPAIPNDEIFDADGTYGPKANFKISLRELPDNGRFRVTVTAAKYNDGLLLDKGSAARPRTGGVSVKGVSSVNVPKAGLYQVDAYVAPRGAGGVAPDASRLKEGLGGAWKMDELATAVASPFGKALTVGGDKEALEVGRVDVGEGEFTIAAWIQPKQPRRAGIVGAGGQNWVHGWALELGEGRGGLKLETYGPDGQPNGTVISEPGVVKPNVWTHVAAVVKRGKGGTQLYVNGYPVGRGEIGAANLDNERVPVVIGKGFRGDLDEVHLYKRALSEAELQALIEPGRAMAKAPEEKPQDLTLGLGGRQFIGQLDQPAFVVVRLAAGAVQVTVKYGGGRGVEELVFTPLAETEDVAKKFLAFEKRAPKLGVHLGLRRDCGSTFAPVGGPKAVGSDKLSKFVFEGAIRNFPAPFVEKDNVNYLAGVKEIAVRSEYTDGRDMPRMVIRSVEFEGPLYDVWPPATYTKIFGESKDARTVITRFAAKAYRRPVTAAEEKALVGVFDKSLAAGAKWQDAVKDALQVVLTSPQFLFLVEKSATPGPEQLDDYELASKLSYFLWNGPPDARTLGLAKAGTLRAQLDAEVARMAADPKFSQFTKEFAYQWLSLDKFQVVEVDRKKYPKLTRDARLHLKQEPVKFVEYLLQKNLPAKNLISSDFVLANETVASYYDLDKKPETGFEFVAIEHKRRELGGLLTQAAILSGLSDGRESNPVKRGAWMARKIVSEPPDDPPPNVPALKDDPKEELTLRQRIERHRNQPGCVQCHLKIDPWGIALEEFDAGGRLKTKSADARSTLPDKTEVKGAAELKKYLSEDRIDQVAYSVLKHLAVYASGRSLTYNEQNRLKKDALQLKASGYRMQDMLRFVVRSPIFLEK